MVDGFRGACKGPSSSDGVFLKSMSSLIILGVDRLIHVRWRELSGLLVFFSMRVGGNQTISE